MDTLSELKTMLKNIFDIDPATLDVNAPMVDYGLDSLSLAELLFAIEDHFHIDFAETPRDVTTLGGLVERIDSMRAEQKA